MSYILDALKHSQDSRGRGAVPDLASQMAAARPGPTRSERIWRMVALATVLVLLAVLAVLGWQRWLAPSPVDPLSQPPVAGQPEPAAAPASTVQSPASQQIAAQPLPAPAAVQAPGTASTEPPPAAAPSVTAAPAVPAPADPVAPAGAQAPGLAALQELAGVRVNVDEPKPVSPQAPAAAPAGPPPVVQKLELPMERPPVAAPRPQPLVPALPTPPAVPASGPQIAEYGEVEHWKQLPAQVQQQLREMPFNVHIYASDPKLRFVKTGGRTLREGDAINAELKVLHITRDGLIVGYKGGKYWMRLS